LKDAGRLPMKPTESYEQLIDRFVKRTAQLTARKEELQEVYDEYVKIEKDLDRLQGSLQAVEYLAFGKLPGDGNHDGMKNHQPKHD
jgi:predicted nuclease with TOPRIM domain